VTNRIGRWITGWGATDRDRTRTLPGDDVIPGRVVTATNAITIEASPESVWPWLVQMGQGRAGFYTFTWIENFLGAHIHNVDQIEPSWQHLEPGDRIRLTPEKYLGRFPGQYWTVRSVDTGHALVLSQSPPENPHPGTWSLVLEPAGHGRTRLLSRHTQDAPGRRLARRANRLFWTVGASFMEYGVLQGIKRRSEGRTHGRHVDGREQSA
jgi:hypothetical protein